MTKDFAAVRIDDSAWPRNEMPSVMARERRQSAVIEPRSGKVTSS